MAAKKRVLSKSQGADYRKLFDSSPQPMWVVDRESLGFLDVNQAALDLYGWPREEFLAMALPAIASGEDEDSVRQWFEHAVGAPHSSNGWKHRRRDGKALEIEAVLRPVEFAGRPAVVAAVQDVTQRKLLEEQLNQSQKMEAVGMLAGGIAHDFNNLLTIITGYSQLLLNSMHESDTNRLAVEQVMKAGERAAALTGQLLLFSRRQKLQPKVLDLNDLVSGTASMLRRLIGEDIDLRLVLGADLGRVSADPGRLEQALVNLVVNARDAMPKGGLLTVETANVTLGEDYINTHIQTRPGSYVMLAVSDNGHGMDAETRARLFEPFFTTKAKGKGTGLGLSTVFGVVRQSGGTIEVYSERGQGTSFKIYLPRIDQAATIAEKEQAHSSRPGHETLLIVEDDEMVRRLVRDTLEREGYRILDAGSPEDASRIAARNKRPIDLMITDVVLPQMNGKQLAEQLGRDRPEMRVLYMSGYTDNAVVASAGLPPGSAFLQKPFTPGALSRRVRELLDNRAEGQIGTARG